MQVYIVFSVDICIYCIVIVCAIFVNKHFKKEIAVGVIFIGNTHIVWEAGTFLRSSLGRNMYVKMTSTFQR